MSKFKLNPYQTLEVMGALLVLLAGLWWGLAPRFALGSWDYFTQNPAGKQNLEKALEAEPHNPLLHYNLAGFLYQEHNWAEANRHWQEVLASPELDFKLLQASLFNLGNGAYQLSLAQQDLDQAIAQVRQALAHYQRLLEANREATSYGLQTQPDPDLLANLQLAKNRLKLLLDQKKHQPPPGKPPHQQLAELIQAEEQLQSKLAALAQTPPGPERDRQRHQLLDERQRLKAQFELLLRQIQPAEPPTPQALPLPGKAI